MTSRTLLREALKLPQKARAALAAELMESLDALDLGDEWEAEIQRRIADVDSGKTKTIPWARARRRIMATARAPRR